MVPTFSDSARFGSCCAYLLKFLVNGAGSDGRCNTFSNRLVQWDFSRSNHLRVLFFVDLSSEDEFRRLKLLHLDTELVLHRPIESTGVTGEVGLACSSDFTPRFVSKAQLDATR